MNGDLEAARGRRRPAPPRGAGVRGEEMGGGNGRSRGRVGPGSGEFEAGDERPGGPTGGREIEAAEGERALVDQAGEEDGGL